VRSIRVTTHEYDETVQAAKESITVTEDGRHAAVSVAGTTGHHEPGERAAMVRDCLADERLDKAERVTAAVPRGDTEALEEARRQLAAESARAAGASVIVDGSKHGRGS
jgi:hypothetical protein